MDNMYHVAHELLACGRVRVGMPLVCLEREHTAVRGVGMLQYACSVDDMPHNSRTKAAGM